MSPAEALSLPDEPNILDVIALLGWPWQMAGGLLLLGPAIYCLSSTGFLDPGLRAMIPSIALACILAAAGLALGGTFFRMRGLLHGQPLPEHEHGLPAGGDGLRQAMAQQAACLRDIRHALNQAAGTQETLLAAFQASRAPAPGSTGAGEEPAFVASLQQAIALHHRQLGETTARLATLAERMEAGPRLAAPPQASPLPERSVPERLELVLRRLEAAVPESALSRVEHCAARLESASAGLALLPQATASIGQTARRLDHLGDRLGSAGTVLTALPALTEGLASAIEEIGRAAQRLRQAQDGARPLAEAVQALGHGLERVEAIGHRLEAAGGGPSPDLAAVLRQALGEAQAEAEACLRGVSEALAAQMERATRRDAVLGDAARYLTETTDRFHEDTLALETLMVRLQALLSIAGNR